MKGWPVKQVEIEFRRGAVLLHLAKSQSSELSDEMLKVGANAYGYPTSSEEMADAIDYLERQRLVEQTDVGGLVIVRLTAKGRDLALGRDTMKSIMIPDL
jgi:hypothetical protein